MYRQNVTGHYDLSRKSRLLILILGINLIRCIDQSVSQCDQLVQAYLGQLMMRGSARTGTFNGAYFQV